MKRILFSLMALLVPSMSLACEGIPDYYTVYENGILYASHVFIEHPDDNIVFGQFSNAKGEIMTVVFNKAHDDVLFVKEED